VAGNFTQSTTSTSFRPSGSHTTILNGTAAQTVTFSNPNTTFGAGNSQFANLTISNPNVTLASNIAVAEKFSSADAVTARTLISSGGTRTAYLRRIGAENVTFDNVLVDVSGSFADTADNRFNNNKFQNMPTTAVQFRLSRGGGTFNFAGLTFPVATDATQPDGVTGFFFVGDNTSGVFMQIIFSGMTPNTPDASFGFTNDKTAVTGSTLPTISWNNTCQPSQSLACTF
jgi:hypothetical protein